jgi:glyoxylase-like metal-dependent hydrolase (beta-lactamase superfamily II)
MAEEPWSSDYVRAKGKSYPRGEIVAWQMNRAVPDWDSFCVLPATETFEESYTLTLGGYEFYMEHVAGQHEPDQCIIHIRPGNVLFLGDATYGSASSTAVWNRQALADTLRGFMDRGAEWFIEGHRTPADRQRFEGRIERLESGEK